MEISHLLLINNANKNFAKFILNFKLIDFLGGIDDLSLHHSS